VTPAGPGPAGHGASTACSSAWCFSRYAFLLRFRQGLPSVLESLESAWVLFGGVVHRVVADNLKPVVTRADRYAPTLDRVFLKRAQLLRPRRRPVVALPRDWTYLLRHRGDVCGAAARHRVDVVAVPYGAPSWARRAFGGLRRRARLRPRTHRGLRFLRSLLIGPPDLLGSDPGDVPPERSRVTGPLRCPLPRRLEARRFPAGRP